MVRFIVFCCTLGCLLTACSSQYYVRRGNKIYDTGRIAELYARMEDEEKAKEYYQEYETLFGDGKGNDGLYRLGQISQDRLQEGRYTVALKKELNSRNSDFSPIYFAGDTCTVYFSSTRKSDPLRKKIKRDPITGDGYSHLYKAEYVQEERTGRTGKK